ncbi:MAG: hypothetical protein R3A51_19055 [Nannocystaceae bacterium]
MIGSPWPLALALVVLAIALLERWRRVERAPVGVDALVVQGASALVIVGLLATGLALAERLTAGALALACAGAAGLTWPWGLPRPPPRSRPRGRVELGLAALVLVGVGLRLPHNEAELGGRDQGTYVLRARHTAETGAVDVRDPALAQASDALGARAGPGDVLGLYPIAWGPEQAWRRGLYDAPYRPGFYLADRDAGRVTPQFLHLHPTLMAVAGLLLGPARVDAVITLEAALALLAMFALARRLWPERPAMWWTATLLFTMSPVVIWVQRTPLTETLTGLLALAAALAIARAPDDDAGLRAHAHGAALLGAAAWVRGNLWLALPIVLVILAARPSTRRRRRHVLDALPLVALASASLVVHAYSSFPYLHDELGRQLPLPALTPATLATLAIAGCLLWLLVDGALARCRAAPRPRLARAALWLVAAIAVLGVGIHLWLRSAAPVGAPYSRLDPAVPLVGQVTLALALIGLARLVASRPRGTRRELWLIALAALAALSLLVYAPRNLPHRALYYYGRYLVPELIPAAILLAVHGLVALTPWLERVVGRSLRRAAPLTVAAAALGAQSWVLISAPITRLPEFLGAGASVDWLAARIPEDALVIAGGEGWHQTHTFNQVGGALAIGRGRTVLPYHSHEAAHALLHELLIAGPAARGEPAPRVFLLVNEATHNYRPRRDADGEPYAPHGPRTAAFDDVLAPPFRAASIDLVELQVDRLTPDDRGPPTKVTRSELRMALVEVTVDATLAARTETWRFVGGAAVGPAGLELRGGTWRNGHLCLAREEPLQITLPPGPAQPGWLTLVAGPGTERRNPEWRITVDRARLEPRLPHPPRPRPRDTLGPFARAARPRVIELRGGRPTPGAPCPHGALAELRLAPPTSGALARGVDVARAARTFEPPRDLGHPIEPTRWVAGRSISRFRAGTRPTPRIEALAMRIGRTKPLRFAPLWLPGIDARGQPSQVDVIVTLKRSRLHPRARLQLTIDGVALPAIDPPDERDGIWQSEPLRLQPEGPVVAVELAITGGGKGDEVFVRDVAFFTVAPAIVSVTGDAAERSVPE